MTSASDNTSIKPGMDTATFGTGCFWCTEAIFQQLEGVEKVTSGYSGGHVVNPTYEEVCSKTTGHAESIRIVYDPAKVSYGTLLRIYFSVAHDPTELNYQGPDHGPSYRSAIFPQNPEQKRVAAAYIAQLDKARVYPKKIVTKQVTKVKCGLFGRG